MWQEVTRGDKMWQGWGGLVMPNLCSIQTGHVESTASCWYVQDVHQSLPVIKHPKATEWKKWEKNIANKTTRVKTNEDKPHAFSWSSWDQDAIVRTASFILRVFACNCGNWTLPWEARQLDSEWQTRCDKQIIQKCGSGDLHPRASQLLCLSQAVGAGPCSCLPHNTT